jgi:DDE family transposase
MPVGKWQALNLALLSFGIVMARSCTLSLVAEKLWAFGKADSIERRLQRFLNNQRVVVQQCSTAWARWVLTNLRPSTSCTSPIVLLVDETKLADHLSIMVLALAYRKRAIPLAWRCYHQQNWPCTQVQLITSLLSQVAQAIPPGVVPLVQADRGIGTSPELIRAIEAIGWHFLFRVQGQCRFWKEDTQEKEASALIALAHRGRRYCGRGKVFKKAANKHKELGWLECQAYVKWPRRFKEPWCLITNSPYVTADDYAMRVWEEESFRDLKSGGWQWQRSHVWKPAHAARLVLAMSIAYAFTLSVGTAAIRAGKQTMRQITRGHRHQYSVFRLGLRYLSHLLSASRPKPLTLHLFLVPRYPPC